MIKAAFDALARSNSPRSVASRRGKKVSEIIGKRGAEADARE
jgi:small subunit ribosomal protein S5